MPRWLCHDGNYVSIPDGAPLTLLGRFDRMVHRIGPAEGGFYQVLTWCGRRGCVGEMGVDEPIDCPECLEHIAEVEAAELAKEERRDG